LRDSNILFTVGERLTDADAIGYGQIWKAGYDAEYPTQDNTLQLLYTGDLNFSKDHPIEAIARYENRDKQYIYFTDNNNPPRRVNVVDPNTFALDPDEFLISSKARLYPAYPSLETQIGGTLPTGIFYLTYKLQKFGGSITPIAPFSGAVSVNADTIPQPGDDTNYEFINYALTTIGTEKSISYVIPNLPEGYDKIYVYAVYEKGPADYLAYIIEETNLSQNLSYEITLSSIGDKRKIDIKSLFSFDVDFERVKTIIAKDNRLLFGNVKQAAFDLDWDARAYRFTKGKQSYVTINKADTKNWSVPDTADVVNPFNDDRTASMIDPFMFDDAGKLGGNGPNVSYEFVTEDIVLDKSRGAKPSNEEFNTELGSSDAPSRTP
jgi:hypothetical protein